MVGRVQPARDHRCRRARRCGAPRDVLARLAGVPDGLEHGCERSPARGVREVGAADDVHRLQHRGAVEPVHDG